MTNELKVNGHVFEIQSDNLTIRVTCPDGNGYSFASCENLGNIIALQPKGKGLLIIREYGVEAFQAAIDPSRMRLEVKNKSNRRFLNLKQVEYRLNRQRRAT